MRFSTVLLSLLGLTLTHAQNCNLVVPAKPLTAAGLATPYILQTPAGAAVKCTMTNQTTQAFVHGVIIDSITGQVSVYNPLVIADGTNALIQPKAPTLTVNSIVALWFGYNGGVLTLLNAPGTQSLADGNCVAGLVNATTGVLDPFGQFAYCNAPTFFQAAQNLIDQGKLVVPPLGTAPDGGACPSVRSWDLIDQDQSDNVPTSYLINMTSGQTAQLSAANQAVVPGAIVAGNPSDNVLETNIIAPALGCQGTVWKVPDLVNDGAMTTALPLNELQAQKFTPYPQALTPLNHAFTMLQAGGFSQAKTNLYRQGVYHPSIQVIPGGTITLQANPTIYCKQMNQIGGPRLAGFKNFYLNAPSPAAGADTLYAFLTQRFTTSNMNLNCGALIGAGALFTAF